MMKYFFIIILGLFFVACTSKNDKVKNLNDVIPSSERDYDEKDSNNRNGSDTLKMYQKLFSKLGKLDSLAVYEEDLFPDRVGPERMEKYRLNFEGEEVIFAKWVFSDSLRVTNALFNWADCFGPNCNSIKIGEEKNLQRNSFQILVSDTSLYYLESAVKLDGKKWDEYFEEQGYELDWNYRIEQARNGKVRWFNYIDEKKVSLKNKAL